MATNLAILLFGDATAAADNIRSGGIADEKQDKENSIIAWINANPPDLPEAQNNCAACGEFIPVYDTSWVFLGDGALIHYSGKYGLGCWEVWKSIKRETAQAAISQTITSSKTGVDDENIF